MDIFYEVNRFRSAIDKAYKNGEFKETIGFRNFPNECCDLTCDLLGQYLLEKGIKTRQINGAFKEDNSRRHVWLVTNDEFVIDITRDQFDSKISSLKGKTCKVYLGGNEIQELFCDDIKIEDNTNFVDRNQFGGFDKQPNPRQRNLKKIYDIIQQYL